MQKLKVGFSRPKKWKPFAWLIMLGFHINYDHVYLRLRSDRYDRSFIYQASKSMVNFMGLDIFLNENLVIEEFDVDFDDENYIKLMQFAIDNAGKPYGIKEAIGMAIVRIFSLFGKQIKNPIGNKNDTYVCSKLIGYVLEQFHGDVLPADIEDMTPPVVFEYLKQKLRINN